MNDFKMDDLKRTTHEMQMAKKLEGAMGMSH